MNAAFGKILILIGVLFVLFGLILSSGLQIPWIGRLPGDIHIKREHFQFYFPLATSILVSLLLTLIFYFIRK